MKIAEEIHQEGMQVGLLKGKEEGLQEGLQKGLQKGLLKGKQEGRHEEKIIIAKNLLSQAVDIKLITQVTGLSEAELVALHHSLKDKKV